MYHTAVTTPGTLRLLLTRTTPGPLRSRAESRRLLLARDYSWPVTPGPRSVQCSPIFSILTACLPPLNHISSMHALCYPSTSSLVFILPGCLLIPTPSSSSSPYVFHPSSECFHSRATWLASLSLSQSLSLTLSLSLSQCDVFHCQISTLLCSFLSHPWSS